MSCAFNSWFLELFLKKSITKLFMIVNLWNEIPPCYLVKGHASFGPGLFRKWGNCSGYEHWRRVRKATFSLKEFAFPTAFLNSCEYCFLFYWLTFFFQVTKNHPIIGIFLYKLLSLSHALSLWYYWEHQAITLLGEGPPKLAQAAYYHGFGTNVSYIGSCLLLRFYHVS